MRDTLLFYGKLIISAVKRFVSLNLFTYSAALAYYTIFSLPPMLLVVLVTASRFYTEADVRSAVFGEIGNLVGQDGASQLMDTLDRLQILEPEMWSTILSIGVLIFTSTTVFVTMQNTLNKIFGVKPAPTKSGILIMLKDRIISFALLLAIAFILIVSLSLNALLIALQNYLETTYGAIPYKLAEIAGRVVPLIITTVVFAMIFRFLPDVRLAWKNTWFGAVITTLLFAVGEHLISLYIGQSQVAGLYDTAGSIMVIMIWVYYASMIFLLGAVLTRERVDMRDEKIQTTSFAIKIKEQNEQK